MTKAPRGGSAAGRAERDHQRDEYVGESGIVGPGDETPVSARIGALDGLRAIAILLVVAHNAGAVNSSPDGLGLKLWAVLTNAGWVGVQLFFALSGFLITRILLESKGGDGWMRSFYVRRVLRIVPLYYALLLVVFVVAPHLSALAPIATHGPRSTLWYWTYLSNWAAPFGGLARGLPHVWSLAVEEQFYLVWPLVVALLGDAGLAVVCMLLVAAALVVRVGVHAAFPTEIASSAAYTWTIARWDAIALGALAALGRRDAEVNAFLRAHTRLLIAGVTVALFVVVALARGLSAQGTVAEVFSQPLTGVLSALVVFACVSAETNDVESGGAGRAQPFAVRWLSSRPLRLIGKYSYATYIIHLPLHLLLGPHVQPMLTTGDGTARFVAHVGYTAVVFGLSLALSMVTWVVIEDPALSLKRYFPMPARRR